MRALVACVVASVSVISGAALLRIWWIREATKRRWKAAKIIIVDEEDFNEKKQILFRGGKSALQVIMDFDYTITGQFLENGDMASSTHGVFSRSGLLPESFVQLERDLYEKYYQHEIDPNLTQEERFEYMKEWWTLAHENLVRHRITVPLIEECLHPLRSEIVLRHGCRQLLNLLQKNDIPLLVFSAGIADIIERYMEQQGLHLDNVHILSNRMVMDEAGCLVAFQQPIVHSANKALLVDRAAHVLHPERAAFIVVGDHIHDALMCDSIPYAEVHLKVGLLNTNVSARLDEFKEVYDVIIVDDGPLDFLYDLILEISKN
ncbi:5'-nucleotidase [Plasmodiophora brassicae]|uniref:5'-nucleotidase n=1 Tax=Plasmodiophora brassicae TaxID=37360 RepID=A0A3P3YCB1_PLABS|nr:unnamed protein product [Plasmodiophora brassicae]